MATYRSTAATWLSRGSLPTSAALTILIIAGFFLLNRADHQARDTIRKHHIEDIEGSLYFARRVHGTFPPYDEPTWCGRLSHPDNQAIQAQVEESLRAQHEKYANPAKPFPGDPRFSNTSQDYFYWKRSPGNFELYAVLEEEPTGERRTSDCPSQTENIAYDYGITSLWREMGPNQVVLDIPL